MDKLLDNTQDIRIAFDKSLSYEQKQQILNARFSKELYENIWKYE